MMTTKTEAPAVRVGQVWMSNDKRESEKRRHAKRFRVVQVDGTAHGAVAWVEPVDKTQKTRRRSILLERFRATATGYVLVPERAPSP
jgi:hypothetical protein